MSKKLWARHRHRLLGTRGIDACWHLREQTRHWWVSVFSLHGSWSILIEVDDGRPGWRREPLVFPKNGGVKRLAGYGEPPIDEVLADPEGFLHGKLPYR